MAILFNQSGVVLTCCVGDVEISTNKQREQVVISDEQGNFLISENYYAFNNRITLRELGSMFELDMRAKNVALTKYRIWAGGDSKWITVLYCSRMIHDVNITRLLADNFLTTCNFRRVPEHFLLPLSLYAVEGETLEYSVACEWISAKSKVIGHALLKFREGLTAPEDGVNTIFLSGDELVSRIALEECVPTGDVKLVSVTVRCGQRAVSCFMDRSLSLFNCFHFRNCFNVDDNITLPVETKAKTESSNSVAVINERYVTYDRSQTKSYEVEAGPLTSDEAEHVEQLFASHLVYLPVQREYDIYYKNVIISSSTCEVTLQAEAPATVKFTWQFDETRPFVKLLTNAGVFTDTFDFNFS